jgi:hypothetical protein
MKRKDFAAGGGDKASSKIERREPWYEGVLAQSSKVPPPVYGKVRVCKQDMGGHAYKNYA